MNTDTCISDSKEAIKIDISRSEAEIGKCYGFHHDSYGMSVIFVLS